MMRMLIDKTDEREAQEKTQKCTRDFQGSEGYVLIVDERGRFLDVNPRYAEILGYDCSELICHTSRKIKIVFDEDLNVLRENFMKVLDGQSVKFTFRAKCKNGEERCLKLLNGCSKMVKLLVQRVF